MKGEHRYIIDQLVKEQQWKKDNGPIEMTADQLWKYSGEIEEIDPNLDEENVYFVKYYKKRIQDKDIYILLNKKESLIVDYFYRNCNNSIVQMSEDLKISVSTITHTISKHLKIMKNDKNNTD